MNNDSIMSEHIRTNVAQFRLQEVKLKKKQKTNYVKHKTLKKKRLCADIDLR